MISYPALTKTRFHYRNHRWPVRCSPLLRWQCPSTTSTWRCLLTPASSGSGPQICRLDMICVITYVLRYIRFSSAIFLLRKFWVYLIFCHFSFQKVYCEFDTKCSTRPQQLAWWVALSHLQSLLIAYFYLKCQLSSSDPFYVIRQYTFVVIWAFFYVKIITYGKYWCVFVPF